MTYHISVPERQGQKRIDIDLPASKSLSNRALILKALCDGDCRLSHLSDCDDTRVMLEAFEGDSTGNDGAPRTVDIGAAGTSMRFLTAYFAAKEGAEVIMTGSERMKQRPIGILVDALRELGAQIEYTEQEGFPPLRISGKKLKGGTLSIDGITSSQYISALLMIAPCLSEGLDLTLTGDVTSRPYIEMTRQMMQEFGVETEWTNDHVIHIAPQTYQAKAYAVESDWSAASYWYEMVALTQDEAPCVTLPGLFRESLQGDSAAQEMFRPLGVETTFVCQEDGSETVRLSRSGKPCKHLELNLMGQPDLAQTLIVCCAMLGTTFRFSGLASLKIKETNRTAALQTELRKLGFVVHEEGDSVVYWDGERCEAEAEPIICTY